MTKYVKVASGYSHVPLPDGNFHEQGSLIALSDAQYAAIPVSILNQIVVVSSEPDGANVAGAQVIPLNVVLQGTTGPQGPLGPMGPQGLTGPSSGVTSLNGQTGALTAALPDLSNVPSTAFVASVDGSTGPVSLSATYVPMAPAPSGDTTGATDRAALQAYLNAAVAAGTGKTVTVQLQRGVYWLDLAPGKTWALSIPSGAAGVEIVGAGQALTTVKLAAGLGAYLAMWQVAGDAGRLVMHDLTIDHNEQNNSTHLAQADIGTAGRITLNVSTDSNSVAGGASGGVDIHRVTVANFDSVNCFNIHGDKGINLGPVSIKDNTFIPAAITGGNDHDHSTVYWQETVNLYAGCVVRGNRFRPAAAGLAQLGAAIECHGSGYTVEDNDVLDYPVGVQAAADSYATTEQVAVRGNRLRGVAQGVATVVAGQGTFTSGVGLNGATISDNDILIDRDQWWSKTNGLVAKTGCGVLFNQPAAAFEVRNVDITDNRIRFTAITSLATGTDSTLSHGVVYYRPSGGTDTRIRIRDNNITDAPQSGVYVYASTGEQIEVDGNTITNPGSISDAASSDGIQFSPAVSLSDCTCSGNRILDAKATGTMGFGINAYTGNPVTNCQMVDNQVRRVNGALTGTVTQGTAAGTQWFLRGRMVGTPVTYAAYGSTMVDDTNGKVWVQTVSPGGGTWQQQTLP